MTSRERVAALLRKEIPDCFGLYEHFWPETLRDFWPQQGYPQGAVPEEFFNYDIVNCGGWFDTAPFIGKDEVLEENAEWKIIRDGRGARMKYWKNKSGTPEHIGFEVNTPEIWQKYREQLLGFNRERVKDLEPLKKQLAKVRAANRFAVFGNLFVFELLRCTLGDETYLPALLLEPDWIKDFCQVYLDCYRTHYEVIFREAGVPDGMFIYEDFGYSNGLFCSPKTMSELIIPYEKALVSFFKDYGLPVILHSCGDIRKAVPLIIEAGFDCLQPMEAKAGCNVVEFARLYGNKLAYMGNLNVVALNTNDRQTVKDEILPKLTALKKMRIPYFFHSDHSIPPDVQYETYKYALEQYRENKSY